MAYNHGGDVYSQNRVDLDFSISLNPLGMPPGVREAVRDTLADCARYPDPHCRGLRKAISRRDRVPEGYVLCGNGAADLIWRLALARRPRRALITAPTFSEYGQALAFSGCRVEEYPLLQGNKFDLTDAVLDRIIPGVELVFLCDPNNPTGRLIPMDLLQQVLGRCRRVGAVLAVDQCFLELTGDRRDKLVEELPGGGLILLRALTKSYAMAGLRLGYALCAEGTLLEKMAGAGPPWPVSTPAQVAGEVALQRFPDWPLACLPLIEGERNDLEASLSRLGFSVWPSQANYLLFAAPCPDLRRALLGRGILIRDCASFSGLGEGYYRVGIKHREENRRLIQALRNLTGGN